MVELNLKNKAPIQSDFWGNNAVYMGYSTIPDDFGRAYSEELIEKEFDLIKQSGITMARTFYHYNFAYDEQKGCFDFTMPRMQGFCRWLKKMQEMGIDVIMSLGWWFPDDINNSGHRFSPVAVEGDWEQCKKNYAKWAVDTLNYIKSQGINSVKIITVFTEPQYEYHGELPEGRTQFEAWNECLIELDGALKVAGIRQDYKLMGPNEGSTVTSEMLEWVAKHADEYIDIYSSHNYMHTEMKDRTTKFSGNRAVAINTMGGRVSQLVALKPNTNYTIKAKMKLDCPNMLGISGYVLMGAYKAGEGKFKKTFLSGGQPTTRLTSKSSYMIDGALLSDCLEEYTYTFNSEDNTSGLIGVFFDIKIPGSILYVDSMSLKEQGSDEELLKDTEFATPFEWDTIACDILGDCSYLDWCSWAKTGMSFVPNGKPYIFDEYNYFTLGRESLQIGTAQSLAKCAFMNSGANSSLVWTLMDQLWPSQRNTGNGFDDGTLRHGIAPLLTEGEPFKAMSAFAITSRFFKKGQVFKGEGTGNLQLSALKTDDGNLSIMVVNFNDQAYDFKVTAEQAEDVVLNRYLYSETSSAEITPDKTVTMSTGFTDSIPPYGVAVYTTIKE